MAVAAILMSARAADEPPENTDISQDTGNSDTITGNLEEQKRLESSFGYWQPPRWLESARKTRDGWLEQIGLNIGASYHVAGLVAFGGDEDVSGFSGDLTVEGTWQLIGKKWNRPLDLHFRVRHRHELGSRAASEVAEDSGGLLWNLTSGFSNAGLEVPDFKLVQHFPDRNLDLIYGQMTIDALFDRHSLRSAKRAFMNRAFSKNPAAGFPRFGTGVAMVWNPDNGFDLTVGASSVQGTQNGDQVDFDLGSGDLFTAAQLGYDFTFRGNPARLQAMVWHADPVEHARVPEGEGVSLTFEHWLASSNNRLFVRLAWADGAASDTDRFIAAGFATGRRENDLFGLAIGAGRDSFRSGDWQGVVETFYRWQIGPHFILTPSAQVVFGNGLQPDHPFRLVAGIKGAVTF